MLSAAKLVAAALLVLGIYFFIKQHPWQSHGWRGIGWSYLYFVCFVLLGIALLKWIQPVNVPSTRYGRMAFGFLAAGMVFLFVFKYLQNIDCFPVVLCSEADNASVSSVKIWNRLSGGSLVPPKGYNLGMGYLYLPLYAIWGKSIWATKILYVVCWTLSMLAIAAVWWCEYRHEGLLSILLVISTLSYGLAIERRYKWHIVSVLLVASVFWVISRVEHRKRWYHYPLLGIVLTAGIASG